MTALRNMFLASLAAALVLPASAATTDTRAFVTNAMAAWSGANHANEWGAWTYTGENEPALENGALSYEFDEGESLRYAPTAPSPAGLPASVSVTGAVFQVGYAEPSADVVAGRQAAIALLQLDGDTAPAFYGWAGGMVVTDGGATTNLTWIKLAGAQSGATTNVVMDFDYASSPKTVAFKINGATLSDAATGTTNDFPLATDQTHVTAVGFSGAGSFTGLGGSYDVQLYEVTFFDGATEYPGYKQVVEPGALASRPTPDPDKNGFSFTAWTNGLGVAWAFATDTVTNDTRLGAQWTVSTVTLTVPAVAHATMAAVAGGEPLSGTVDGDNTVFTLAPGTAVDVTYTADTGYHVAATGNKAITLQVSSGVMQNNFTLDASGAAMEIDTYTVTFTWHDGSMSDDYVYGTEASDIAVPRDPPSYVENGVIYSFTGWSAQVPATLTGAVTITAQYDSGVTAEAMVISVADAGTGATTTNYVATLADAFGANGAQDGDTVELLSNVTLTERLEPNVGAGTSLTIDLGGYTITREGTSGNGSVFDVKSGDVLITNGVIVCTQDDTAIAADGVYAITSRSGSNVTLADLTVTVDSECGACAYPFAGSTMTIESGTYANVTTTPYRYNMDITGMAVNQPNDATQNLVIKGGSFSQYDPQLGDDSGAMTDFTDDGFVAIDDGNGHWVVQPGYNVTFNANGGDPTPAAQRVAAGALATAPATNPTKAGDDTVSYVFNAWQLNDADFDFAVAPAADITLVADYTAISLANAIWIGGAQGDWNVPANWDIGYVPTKATVVTFTNDAQAAIYHGECVCKEMVLDDADVTIVRADQGSGYDGSVDLHFQGNAGSAVSGTGTLGVNTVGLFNNNNNGVLTIGTALDIQGSVTFKGNKDNLQHAGSWTVTGKTTIADGVKVSSINDAITTFQGDIDIGAGSQVTFFAAYGANENYHGGEIVVFKVTLAHNAGSPSTKLVLETRNKGKITIDDSQVVTDDAAYEIKKSSQKVGAVEQTTYEVVLKTFSVIWLADDGATQLDATNGVLYGTSYASLAAPTPTKDATAACTYTFAGWVPTPDATVTSNATYTASFTETTNKYDVIWVADGAMVASNRVDYGTATSSIQPADPTKETTDSAIYTFTGWSPEVAATVTQDATYTAGFSAFTLDPVAQELYFNCTSQVAVVGYPEGATFYWTEEVIPGESTTSGGISFSGDVKPLTVDSGRKTNTVKFHSNATNGTWHLTASVTNNSAEVAQLVATVTVKDVVAVVDGVEYPRAQWADAIAAAKANDKVLGVYASVPSTTLAVGETLQVEKLADKAGLITLPTVTGPASTAGTVYVVNKATANGITTYSLTAEEPSVMFVSADGVTTNYLDAAFKTTKAGTYTLLKDVTRSQLSVGTAGVVLDLNGKTFTSTATGTTAAINVTSTTGAAGLTVIDSSEAGTGAIVAPNYSAIQSGKNGSVAIEGGAISGKTVVVYTLSGGTAAISGGTFSMVSGSADSMLNCKDDNRGTITVTGGSFQGFDPATSNSADGNMIAEGYVSVADDPSAGWYTVKPAYTVLWVADGTTLETDENVASNAPASYDGATPTKAATAQYTYTFDTWSPAVGPVVSNTTFTAVFTETLNKYLVTFDSAGGSAVASTNVAYGTTVTKPAPDPTKGGFSFVEWQENGDAYDFSTPITNAITLTARWATAVWEISWYDENGQFIEKTNAEDGTKPSPTSTPTKENTDEWTYEFAGWSATQGGSVVDPLPDATANASYYAVFNATKNQYTVIWVVDGTPTTNKVDYGTAPAYAGTPAKTDATGKYAYAFAGWDDGTTQYGPTDALPGVTGNVTYTAQFSQSIASSLALPLANPAVDATVAGASATVALAPAGLLDGTEVATTPATATYASGTLSFSDLAWNAGTTWTADAAQGEGALAEAAHNEGRFYAKPSVEFFTAAKDDFEAFGDMGAAGVGYSNAVASAPGEAVRVHAKIDVPAEGLEAEPDVGTAAAGFAVLKLSGDGAAAFYAYDGASWTKLHGVAPAAGEADYLAVYDFAASPAVVRYYIDGVPLYAEGEGSEKVYAIPLGSMTSLSTIAFGSAEMVKSDIVATQDVSYVATVGETPYTNAAQVVTAVGTALSSADTATVTLLKDGVSGEIALAVGKSVTVVAGSCASGLTFTAPATYKVVETAGDPATTKTYTVELDLATVIWFAEGGETEVWRTNAVIGTVPVYEGPAQTKAATDAALYTFSGWTDAEGVLYADALPAVAAGGTNYVATFKTWTKVARPTVATGLVYTGEEQPGVTVAAGSTATGTTVATDAGSYPVTVALDSADSVWADATDPADATARETVTADWSIARKAVTVTADDKSKIAGNADPELTATVVGTIGTDTVAYELSRAEGEAAGEYAITPSGTAEQGNYAVSFAPGTFTITGAQAMVISIADAGTGATATNYVATLADAFLGGANGAKDGDTVELLGDVTLDARILVTNSVTIDLGGYTVARTAAPDRDNGSAFRVDGDCDVTIKNGAIDCSGVDDTSVIGDGVFAIDVKNGGDLVLADLDVTVDSRNGACVYPWAGSTVAIESGNYANLTDEPYDYHRNAANEKDWVGMAVNQANGQAGSLITITGGTFSKLNPMLGDDSAAEGTMSFVDPDYFAVADGGAFTVVPRIDIALATVTVADDLVYDGDGKAGVTSVDYGTTNLVLDTDYAVAYAANTNAGTASATLTGVGLWTGTTTANFAIGRKAVTVTADDKSKIAGNADPELTATVVGTIGTDTVAYELSRAEGEAAGEYAITPSGTAEQGNYAVSFVSGTFTITGAQAMVISIADTGTGATATNYVATLADAFLGGDNGAKDGDTVELLGDVTLDARILVTNSVTVDLGGYTVTRTAAPNRDNGSAFRVDGDYDVTIKNGAIDCSGVDDTSVIGDGVFAIDVKNGGDLTLADLDITVDSRNGACVYPWAGSTVAIESGNYANLTDEPYDYHKNAAGEKDWVGMAVNQANNQAQSLITITGGTFSKLNPMLGDDSAAEGTMSFVDPDYFAVDDGGVFTVVPRIDIALATVTVADDLVYNGTGRAGVISVDYGTTNLLLGTDYAVAYASNTNAGVDTASATITGVGLWTGTVSTNFSIAKMDVTVTAASDSKVYDGTALTKDEYTATPLAAGDAFETVAISGSITDVGTVSNEVAAVSITNALGTVVTANYNVTKVSGELAVTPATMTITVAGYAGVYDGAAHVASATTVPAGATVAWSVDGGEFTDTVPSVTGVTNVAIVAKATLANYTDATASTSLVVTAKAITIAADDKTKVYDNDPATDPALTATVTDAIEGDAINYTLARAEGQDVADYAITVTPGENPNYTVSVQSGTFSITAATATIPTAAANLVYDGTEQTGVAEGTGYTIVGNTGTNAGDYTATLTLAANYKWSDDTTDATKTVPWTIAPADATVKADDASKKHGEADPAEFTATVTGLKGSDTEAVLTYTVTRAQGEAVGTYTITPAGNAAQGNYTVTYQTGTFTIVSNAFTVIWLADDGTTEYGRTQVEWGDTPAFSGETPKTDATGKYAYTFAAWTPAPGPATQNTNYVATFTQSIATPLELPLANHAVDATVDGLAASVAIAPVGAIDGISFSATPAAATLDDATGSLAFSGLDWNTNVLWSVSAQQGADALAEAARNEGAFYAKPSVAWFTATTNQLEAVADASDAAVAFTNATASNEGEMVRVHTTIAVPAGGLPAAPATGGAKVGFAVLQLENDAAPAYYAFGNGTWTKLSGAEPVAGDHDYLAVYDLAAAAPTARYYIDGVALYAAVDGGDDVYALPLAAGTASLKSISFASKEMVKDDIVAEQDVSYVAAVGQTAYTNILDAVSAQGMDDAKTLALLKRDVALAPVPLTATTDTFVVDYAKGSFTNENPVSSGVAGYDVKVEERTETVKAYTLDPHSYAITYDLALADASLPADHPTNFTVETLPVALPNASREGWTFKGWTNNVSDNAIAATIPAGTLVDVANVGQWEINKYLLTVNYLYTNGTVAATQFTSNVVYGTEYDVASPAIAGYTADKPTVSGTMGAAPVTVDVTYTVNRYKVRFVDEDGTTVLKPDTEYDYGTLAGDIARPEDPTKAATGEWVYAFAGWKPAVADVTDDAVYTAFYSSNKTAATVITIADGGTTTNETYYASLAEAIGNAPAGSTVRLDADSTDSAAAIEKDITLDLNGNTWTVGAPGTVTVAGAVEIVDSSENGTGSIAGDVVASGANAALTVSGGEVDGDVTVSDGASVAVAGGTVTGDIDATGANTTVVVSGGEVEGAIAADSGAGVSVTGGSVGDGIEVGDGSSVAVSGGEVDGGIEGASGSTVTVTAGTVNGGIDAGGTLAVSGGTVNAATGGEEPAISASGTANISGGTVSGSVVATQGGNVTISDDADIEGNLESNNSTVNVTGGTVNGTLSETNGGDLSVTGGHFTNDPTDYVADGFYADGDEENGWDVDARLSIEGTVITVAGGPYTGTGYEVQSVDFGTTNLLVGTDCTVAYTNVLAGNAVADNVNVGTIQVTVTGIGKWIGTVTTSFVITPAVLTVTAPDKSVRRGTDPATLTFADPTYSGFVNNEDESVLTTPATAAAAANDDNEEYSAASRTGATFPIVASGAAAANYTFTYVEGTLTVVAGAIASVDGTEYEAIADAVAAAGTTEDGKVITMLDDADAAVVLVFGDVLKVALEGFDLTVTVSVADSLRYRVVDSGPVDGVTTYTVEEVKANGLMITEFDFADAYLVYNTGKAEDLAWDSDKAYCTVVTATDLKAERWNVMGGTCTLHSVLGANQDVKVEDLDTTGDVRFFRIAVTPYVLSVDDTVEFAPPAEGGDEP